MKNYFDEVFPSAASNGESGVVLLNEPRTALAARLIFADLAEHSLDLQYYLWKDDLSGNLLLDRVIKAADRGVKVRILMDDVYHNGRDAMYAGIASHANIDVRVFNPFPARGIGKYLGFITNKRELDHRMHNKIYLADHAVSILGGRNIGDDYFGVNPALNFRDLDVLSVGSSSLQTKNAFELYWNSDYAVPISVVHRNRYQPTMDEVKHEIHESIKQQDKLPYSIPVTLDQVQKELDQLRDALLPAQTEVIVDPLERFSEHEISAFARVGELIMQHCESDLTIQSAYLIPTRSEIENLGVLSSRGVNVRVLTNSMMSNNHISVHAHYAKYRKDLIRAGVDLHEMKPDAEMLEFLDSTEWNVGGSHAGLHTKAAVIDQRYAIIGSYNTDPRSRIHNSEIALVIDSALFARQVREVMDTDFLLTNSYQLVLDHNKYIRWVEERDGESVTHKVEPQSTLWERFLAGSLRLLPIEREL